MENIIIALSLSLLIQSIFFIFAYLFKTDKVTDLSYGLTFIIIVIFLLLNNGVSIPNLFVASLVIVWALRLIIYLFIRINKMKRDTRFDGIREKFLPFAKFWFLQGIAVWVILLPTIVYTKNSSDYTFNIRQFIGFMIFLMGFLTETISDYQKYSYKKNGNSSWIHSGLWRYARHPNYFGEMLCWWGIFIICTHSLSILLLTLIGPLSITFLLLFVTGIPPLEKRYNLKFKEDSKYQTYKKESNLLVPVPFKLF
jgi:steroid 5-alpha reductase family enzyme